MAFVSSSSKARQTLPQTPAQVAPDLKVLRHLHPPCASHLGELSVRAHQRVVLTCVCLSLTWV